MSKSEEKRQRWLELITNHILKNGINASSLRPLAKAAGTSDRMLIYHFQTKEQLISTALKFLFERLAIELSEVLPKERASSRLECVQNIIQIMQLPEHRNYANVWLEVVVNAGRGDDFYRSISKELLNTFTVWIESHLPETEPEPKQAAKAVLVILEGMTILTAVGNTPVALPPFEFLLESK